MAAAIFRQIAGDDRIEVLARGIVVQFPEPLNQKTEAIMISNGIKLDEFEAVQLSEDDITEETLIFTMDESQRERVIRELERATEENTFVLSAFVGDELEIMDPYGGSLQSYGLCFEVIKRSIEKLLLKI